MSAELVPRIENTQLRQIRAPRVAPPPRDPPKGRHLSSGTRHWARARGPRRLAAAEGGMGSDDFVLRLIHASHTPPNAPKQRSCPYKCVLYGPVGSGRLQPSSAPCTMHQRPRKPPHTAIRDCGAITCQHNMRPSRRPRSHTPRPSAPLVRADRPAAPDLSSGVSTTTSEDRELLQVHLRRHVGR